MRSLIPSLILTFIFSGTINSAQATNPPLEDCMAAITAERDSICTGESIQLSATNDADIYEWSPANTIIGGTNQNPIISPGATTTYTLTTTVLEDELIQNGGFENGNTDFTSEYEVGTGGTFGLLSDEGTYGIGNDPSALHNNFPACDDHTSGAGNMLVVNGSSSANEAIWCQTINVQEDMDYQFSAWAATMISENPAQLQFSINGALLGEVFNLTANQCQWDNFAETWYSASSTTAEICILNQNTASSGNDFALDDISFRQVCISQAEYTIHVSAPFVAITNPMAIDCNGESGSAFANASGGVTPYTFEWSNGETTQEATNLDMPQVSVTVTDAVGCSVTAEANIGADPFLVLDTVAVTSTDCGLDNGSATLFVGNLQEPFSYSLDGGPFEGDGSSVYTFEDIAPGEHTALVSDANGCQTEYTFTIDSSEGPDVMITSIEADLCETGTMTLDAGVFASYLWSTDATSQTITIDSAGTYSLSIVDDNNCPGEASIEIEFCGGWAVPNAFTPDGDGDNDTFGPVFQGELEIKEFLIVDRWGKVVHDQPVAWDGNSNGKPHPSDVLLFNLVIETPEDGEVTIKGDVTLIR